MTICRRSTNQTLKIYFIDPLTFPWWRSLSYKNQSIDLLCKSKDWFLYDRDVHHERFKALLWDFLENILWYHQEPYMLWFSRAVWKVSQSGVFSSPYFLTFGLNTVKHWIEKPWVQKCSRSATFLDISLAWYPDGNALVILHWSLQSFQEIFPNSHTGNEL